MSMNDVAHAATQLQRAVAIGEESRVVGNESIRVSRLALNAIVLAKRSGEAARGFAEVSHHMSGMSRQLDEGTRDLWKYTAAWIACASALLQRARVARALRQALEAAEDSGADVTAARAPEASVRAAADDLRKAREQLAEQIEESARASLVGIVLSRAARIEACYGGAHREALSQLSTEFSQRAEHIHETLKRMRALVERGSDQ